MIAQDILSVISCSLFLLEGNRQSSLKEQIIIGGIAASYFVIDMIWFVKKIDRCIHHTAAIWIGCMVVYDPYPPDVLQTIANTEWSTLFLTLNNYLTGYWLICSQLAFVGLFIKVRLMALYPLVVSTPLTYIQWSPLVVIYGLNVFWFYKICQKAYHMIKPKSE